MQWSLHMESMGLILIILFLDTKMESCEEERSVLKRRLQASFVEVERQVIEISNYRSGFEWQESTFIVTAIGPLCFGREWSASRESVLRSLLSKELFFREQHKGKCLSSEKIEIRHVCFRLLLKTQNGRQILH